MDAPETSEYGQLILRGPTTVPPWVLYSLALIGLALGAPIIHSAAPLLAGNRPGDFGGGVAGTGIGVILVISGCLALAGARSSRNTVRQLSFHERGVRYGSGRAAPEFTPYEDLTQIEVCIYQPSTVHECAGICLTRGQEERVAITRIDVQDAKYVAECAAARRADAVLTFSSDEPRATALAVIPVACGTLCFLIALGAAFGAYFSLKEGNYFRAGAAASTFVLMSLGVYRGFVLRR